MDSVLIIDGTPMSRRRSAGLFGSCPPPPLYSSLPLFPVAPPLLPRQQPPLLPLPFSNSVIVPSPSNKITAAVRQRPHQKKPRPSAGLKKSARSDRRPVGKSQAAEVVETEKGGEKEKEEFLGVSLYSISPPPSSLPLPRFCLAKPKAAAATSASCIADTVKPGASDDLRRLLRL